MNNCDRDLYMAIDIGGSGIKAVVLDEDDNAISDRLRIDSPS